MRAEIHFLLMKPAARFLLIAAWLVLLPLTLIAQEGQPLYVLPGATITPQSSGSMAFTRSGRIVAANAVSNTVSVVNPTSRSIDAEYAVGREPRAVAVTTDNTRALIVNRMDGTLSILTLDSNEQRSFAAGILPYAVVTRDEVAYISSLGTDEIRVIDLRDGAVLAHIVTPAMPAGLALWGDYLYVTHLWSGQFSMVYLPQRTVVRTIDLGRNASLAHSIEIDARNGLAYIPHSISNADLADATHDNRVLPVVDVVDLSRMQVLPDRRLYLSIADRMVNMPFAVRLDVARNRIYVLSTGSASISVLDSRTGLATAHLRTGASPRSLLLGPNAQTVYAHNAVDQTITAIETRFFSLVDTIPTSERSPAPDWLIGARLFHSATDARMSAGAMSCASCHYDGLSDGRVWDGLNTPHLYALRGRDGYGRWGDWPDLSALDAHIQSLQAGSGLGADSLDMNALIAYLERLSLPQQSAAQVDAVEGRRVFDAQGCASCHTGGAGTGGQRHDVGTGGMIITPPLVGLSLSAPYFHDGSAATLRDIFTSGQGVHRLSVDVTADEIDALVGYLMRLN